MSGIFFGKLKAILDKTTTIDGNVDAAMTTRAPASTALDNTVWTTTKAGYLDKPISEVGGGEFAGTVLNNQEFTSNGTFTVPTGFIGFLFVTLVGGGGGGGGGGTGTTHGGGGGGGGGGFCWRVPVWVNKSETTSVAVTIGTGGAGGATQVIGSQGNNSTFGSYLTAYGGGGGGRNSGVNNWGTGGAGGSMFAKGANGITTTSENDAGVDVAFTLDDFQLFPAWHHMRNSLIAVGAEGGDGDDYLAVGSAGGDLVLPTYLDNWGTLINLKNPVVARSGGVENNDGGGGGASWGDGGDSVAPGYGGGGRGGDYDSAPASQNGGDGYCKVEWWTAT
jgi:hypothetical protein